MPSSTRAPATPALLAWLAALMCAPAAFAQEVPGDRPEVRQGPAESPPPSSGGTALTGEETPMEPREPYDRPGVIVVPPEEPAPPSAWIEDDVRVDETGSRVGRDERKQGETDTAGRKEVYESPVLVQRSPFAGSDLFVGRSVKQAQGARKFEIGLEAQVAPVEVLLTTERDTIVANGIDAACGTDEACRQNARRFSDEAIPVLRALPDPVWQQVEAAANDPAQAANVVRQNGGSEAQAQAVEDYLNAIPAGQRQNAAGVAREIRNRDTTHVLLEPYAIFNFDLAELRIGVPLVISVPEEGGSRLDMGDLNVDGRFGWVFPGDAVDGALTVGLTMYLPTGTRNVSAAALSDLFQAPKFLRDYLTVAPYIVGGVDLRLLSIQAHVEFLFQNRVRDSARFSNIQYFKYGLGLVFAPHFPLSLVAELNGLEPLNNAGAYKALFVDAGLTFRVWILKAAIAVQVPLLDRARDDLADIGNIDVGELSKYTVLTRIAFEF